MKKILIIKINNGAIYNPEVSISNTTISDLTKSSSLGFNTWIGESFNTFNSTP